MEASQYHHYIPRFVLQNFVSKTKHRATRKQNGKKKGGGYWSDRKMLKIVDLEGENPALIESPVSKTFGKQDMYRDLTKAENQHALEVKLSALESQAGEVIAKIKKELFESQKSDVTLTRTQKNTLRKFLFIMKYRGPTQYQRYCHESIDTYSADDKTRLAEYMSRKKFCRPLDVWYHNMMTILAIDMDPDSVWLQELLKTMYPDDAMWFFAHNDFMYLALCTPEDADDEFLLSGNTFSVHEGPQSVDIDVDSGSVKPTAYTELHFLNVIHPRLALVLRSILLPCLEEDLNPEIKRMRQMWSIANSIQHNNPENFGSVLADLPVTKASNSYVISTSHGMKLRQGHDGSFRRNDTFCFKKFKISKSHVTMINTIILENAYGGPYIAYLSSDAFQRYLEHYLTMALVGFKSVMIGDPQHLYLKKLETVAKLLGSQARASYITLPINMDNDTFLEKWGPILEKHTPKNATPFAMLFSSLGGEIKRLPKDLDQTQKIINWRIKLDVYTKGLVETERVCIREKFKDLICEVIPTRRIWLYIKHARYLELYGGQADKKNLVAMVRGSMKDGSSIPHAVNEGAEDIIAKVKHIVKPTSLSKLLHTAGLLDTQRRKISGKLPSALMFVAGSIIDCGIPLIETEAGLSLRSLFYSASLSKSGTMSQEQQLEIQLRNEVRTRIGKVFKNVLSQEDLGSLEHVLFDVLYPCPK